MTTQVETEILKQLQNLATGMENMEERLRGEITSVEERLNQRITSEIAQSEERIVREFSGEFEALESHLLREIKSSETRTKVFIENKVSDKIKSLYDGQKQTYNRKLFFKRMKYIQSKSKI